MEGETDHQVLFTIEALVSIKVYSRTVCTRTNSAREYPYRKLISLMPQ